MTGTLAMPRSDAPSCPQAPARPQAPSRSYALRRVVVAASLTDLRGPTDGLVELPQRLFWSGTGRVFDLADADRLLEMYEAVFDAARTEADLAEHLNGAVLARVWPDLALAPRVRRAWEEAHPDLVARQLPQPELASVTSPVAELVPAELRSAVVIAA